MMFSVSSGDLELRSCNDNLLTSVPHTTAEIIKWERDDEKQYCFAVAYWTRDKEGYDLRFVGDRPFDKDIDSASFMSLAKTGQDLLDIMFTEMKAKEE